MELLLNFVTLNYICKRDLEEVYVCTYLTHMFDKGKLHFQVDFILSFVQLKIKNYSTRDTLYV